MLPKYPIINYNTENSLKTTNYLIKWWNFEYMYSIKSGKNIQDGNFPQYLFNTNFLF